MYPNAQAQIPTPVNGLEMPVQHVPTDSVIKPLAQEKDIFDEMLALIPSAVRMNTYITVKIHALPGDGGTEDVILVHNCVNVQIKRMTKVKVRLPYLGILKHSRKQHVAPVWNDEGKLVNKVVDMYTYPFEVIYDENFQIALARLNEAKFDLLSDEEKEVARAQAGANVTEIAAQKKAQQDVLSMKAELDAMKAELEAEREDLKEERSQFKKRLSTFESVPVQDNPSSEVDPIFMTDSKGNEYTKDQWNGLSRQKRQAIERAINKG